MSSTGRIIAIKLLFFACFSMAALQFSFAQTRTIELKPVQKQGWRFYYDFKRLSTPEALQIPLQALNDQQINQYYQTYQTLQTIGIFVALAPAAYLLSQIGMSYFDGKGFFILAGASFATNIALQFWSYNRMGLAINRYNSLILLPSPPEGRLPRPALPGLSFTIKL